ncbi:phospholipase effector Tle1 domain-containing protein [Flavobacterium branchiicola]|uniref:Phospholipase effector Tle1 domain-containing protein n=1 Tax=Flavobacterium branchiicola TaxID=1114875 RepID=A0ABV9P934_9FLAO|nr:DUF2235 domain-containing protein [Flavobacterium branchiicola]MBS7253673.1 DUF2235 domain-containing protein [Flavobacterium branchiicola]
MGKTFVYNTGASKDDIKKDELHLTFGIFIDGTLNNKDNTDMRNKHSRGVDKNGKVDYSKGNSELESEDSKAYKKIKNKGRIEELLSKKDKTPAEQVEFKAIPERDKYLVASYRVPLNEFGLDRMGTDNSYSNDYTNVARMWQCCEQKEYAIYVPGMGTDYLTRDSQDGFAFGSGQTGIRARVRNACEQIADKIAKKMEKGNENTVLTQITLDVFGFSRGAATARNLVYEVNLDEAYKKAVQKEIPCGVEYQESPYSETGRVRIQKMRTAFVDADNYEIDNSYLIQDQLPKMGHLGYSLLKKTRLEFDDLKDVEIIVRFVGVYDTVSSYFEQNNVRDHYDDYGNLKDEGGKLIKEAWSTHFNDDIAELHLNNLYCQKVVHFTAKDEHRQNFALTRIKQIPGKYIEKNFPGVHCDIGGAYMTEKEVIDEIGTQMKDRNYVSVLPETISYDRMGLDALRGDLIRQYWYHEEQIEINIQWSFPPYSKLTGIRGKKIEGTDDQYEGVKKEYSYIPLHFMEEYARSTEMDKNFKEKTSEKFPLDDFLTDVESYLTPYAMDETNKVKEWDFICDEEIEKKRLEKIEKQKLQTELDNIERKLKDHTYEYEGLKKVTDNLRVDQYKPNLDFGTLKIPQEIDKEVAVAEEPEMRTIDLPGVTVVGYNSQTMLRKLRNEYLHWSSTRDWFGMQPNEGRKRKIH